MTWLIWTCIIVASVVIDQATKLLMVHLIGPGAASSQITVIEDVFCFTYVENPGMAFGTGANIRWLFMTVSTVAILALAVYLYRWKPKSKWCCTAIALIIGGGIGNMIDRVRLGYVVDFLDFCAFDFWVWIFNVADACVCVGGGMLFVWCIVELVREFKKEKESKTSSADGPDEGNSDETKEN